ncbi:protein translocase subunit SecF [Candidatus Roizmanbacteria bacterium]|nr:protein translocase subunit SecF [Candidatus Roizmanbacteria bacterium]
MLNIIGKKYWYFLISLLVIIPGTISLFLWGLNLSIDFTGGSRMTLLFPQAVNEKAVSEVRNVFQQEKVEVVTTQIADKRLIVRTKPLNEKQDVKLLDTMHKKIGDFKQDEFETIGPVIGRELTLNAFKAIVFSSVLIVLYIAWSFRQVPKPVSSWRFGICTILALLHDVLVLVGLFSLLGHFFNVEVDNLFVTAILTVIGFSVHDTIVVFDRIRENLRRTIGLPFTQVVNDSILQTLVRSLNTSLTAILVLFTLLVFGGESIKWFVVALLIGIISGTYSSIFNAAPLLVLWNELDAKRKASKK